MNQQQPLKNNEADPEILVLHNIVQIPEVAVRLLVLPPDLKVDFFMDRCGIQDGGSLDANIVGMSLLRFDACPSSWFRKKNAAAVNIESEKIIYGSQEDDVGAIKLKETLISFTWAESYGARTFGLGVSTLKGYAQIHGHVDLEDHVEELIVSLDPSKAVVYKIPSPPTKKKQRSRPCSTTVSVLQLHMALISTPPRTPLRIIKKVQERVQCFILQWYHGRILANYQKNFMHLGAPFCSRCSEEVETSLHARRDCPDAMSVWLNSVPDQFRIHVEHMRSEKVVPDLLTYCCVVDAYSDIKYGRNFEFVLNKMDVDDCP
ncbi:hypothetical protein MTR_6g034745 [Medicago truncatula]|uniref:Reverse transcriptase zinc-binding domain-containing protein n=1 Tax=Medicago truncatula TaxID=3880 RepID=A0A072U9Q6_MEDTR|nr:hypothetical protein MTR_6g034745 [Medicago truncatula]